MALTTLVIAPGYSQSKQIKSNECRATITVYDRTAVIQWGA